MGSSAQDFAGGFTQGLADVLTAKRRDAQQADERKRAHAVSAINALVGSGQVRDFADMQPLFELAYGDVLGGEKGKGGKGKGQPDKMAVLGQILNPALQQAQSAPETAPAAPGQAPAPEGMSSTPAVPGAPTGAPVAPQRTLMGVPIMSPEEAATRKSDLENQAFLSRVDFVRNRVLPALRAVDPSVTLDDAAAWIGVDMRRAGRQSSSSDPKIGTLGDFMLSAEQGLGRPLTADEKLAKRREWMAQSLGTFVERAAGELGYANAAAARAAGPEAMTKVNQRATELQAEAAGASTTARADAAAKAPLSTAQKFQALTDLQNAWRKAEAPQREMERQYGLMTTGLKRFREGDKVGGSQAVLVTFQKILDPSSVVRESEYARSSSGLALMDRIQGYYDRLKEGGAGVPDEELAAMVETARQFTEGMKNWNDLERERITGTANDFGLNPERVFGVAAVPKPKDGDGAATPPPSSAGSTGFTMDAKGNILQNGKIVVAVP